MMKLGVLNVKINTVSAYENYGLSFTGKVLMNHFIDQEGYL